jgi:hypothetical protein
VIIAESLVILNFQVRKQPHAVPALERIQFRSGTRPVVKLARWSVPFASRSKGFLRPYNFCELSAAKRELPSEPFAASRRLVGVRGGRARFART